MWLHALPAAPGTDAPVVAAWVGEDAVVEVFRDRAWRPVRGDTSSPVALGPLAAGTPVRLRRASAVADEMTWSGVLDPAVFAGLSGPGQRGVDVVGMVAGEDAVWVAIDGVGVARWEGSWTSWLGPEQGLPTRALTGLAVGGDGALWVTHTAGASTGDAASGFHDVAVAGEGRAVLRAGEAVWVADAQGIVDVVSGRRALSRADCDRLFAFGERPLAACGGRLWDVTDGAARVDLQADGALVGIVPRVGGAWIATTDALVSRVDGVDTMWWAAPVRGALRGLGRLGDGLLLATGHDAGLPGLRLHPDLGLLPLRAADGVDATGSVAVAAGPPPGKAWLATDRGLVLVDRDGVGSRLPLAPLAVGVEVRDVAARGRGYAFAGAWGLAWLGPDRPQGWDSLVAAVGIDALRVGVDVAGDVWAVGRGDVFVLRRGVVVRVAAGAPVVDLAVQGDQIAVATTAGVRLGLPGVTSLSPAFAVGTLRALAFDGTGRLALLTLDGVVVRAAGRVAAFALEGATQIVGDGAGFVVTTPNGAMRLDDPDDAPSALGAGVVTAIQTSAGLITLDASGDVQRRRVGASEPLGRWPGARLVPAREGVWILGPHGVAWAATPNDLR